MTSNTVCAVYKNSPADKAGIKEGDIIKTINGSKVTDSLDLAFYAQEPTIEIVLIRNGETVKTVIELEDDLSSEDSQQDIGIELNPFKIKTCKNNCIFCFVSQLPKGLRKTLYVKDEDYRMSFIYGNYVTLTSLTEEERQRIITQRLSPLYVSVHSTNTEIRNQMLANPKAKDIIEELKFLTKHRITVHTQIVLCPDVNDKKELENTITDLYKFYPYLASIAVVPVGLTEYSSKKVRPVEKTDAVEALEIVKSFQKTFLKKHGDCIVFAADELYIKADAKLPPINEYGELAQIENGVGMLPSFIDKAKRFRKLKRIPNKQIITVTGTSFYPFLYKIINKLKEKHGAKIKLYAVENHLFGKSVTVAGLLSGKDIIRTLANETQKDEILLLPDVMLKDDEDVFLDDVSITELKEILNIEIIKIESTFSGLIKALEGLN
ncbi:protein of unknown function DUF512 [Candidatus Magnetoovum chiemensis]|nr:protein of unknown function DUF512 [Candidatus Magnetoovum chiemensis]